MALSQPPAAAPGARPYITIDKVEKLYATSDGPVRALGDISLDIKHGEFLSIVGPSGCGKSTLLKCVAGLQSAPADVTRVKEESVVLPPYNMGVVFQPAALPDRRSVLDN